MTPYWDCAGSTYYHGDARAVLREMPAESVQTCVTSPPYWGLRDYGEPGQLGLEATPEEYVAAMVAKSLGRRAIGIDLSAEYLDLAKKRVGSQASLF